MVVGNNLERKTSKALIINDKEVGNKNVEIKDWIKFFSFGIGNIVFIFSIFLWCAYNVIQIYTYYVIGEFSKKSAKEQQNSSLFYLYLILIIGNSILLSVYYIIVSLVFYTSSKNLHKKMVDRLLRAKINFFDCTSIGSIINKFSKDLQGTGKY